MALSETARYLTDLRLGHRTVDELPAALMPEDLAAGYRTQFEVVDALCEAWGGARAGYKIALTNPAAQRMLGVPHPVFGQLIDARVHASGSTLAAGDYVVRLIECEIAFRIARDIAPGDRPHTRESIADHVGALYPSIEIVEHHFASIDRVTGQSLAADNAIHGAWVHGEPVEDWHALNLAVQPTRLMVNGRETLTGSGGRVLGHPLAAVAWLADTLPRHGLSLREGDYVTTGVTTDEIYPAVAGDELVAEFPRLGEVRIAFT